MGERVQLSGFWRARLERRGEQRGDQGFCDLHVRCSKVVRGKSGQQVAQGSKVKVKVEIKLQAINASAAAKKMLVRLMTGGLGTWTWACRL